MKIDTAGVYTIDEARDLAEMLLSTPDRVVGFDIETGYRGEDRKNGSLDPDTAFVVGFSLTNSRHWARYIPIRHDFGINLPPEDALEIFRPVLERCPIVAHNAAFEERFMAREGVALNILSDTMLEAYVQGRYEEIGLKPLAKVLFGYSQAEITSLWPGPAKGERWHKTVKPPTRNKIRFNPLNSGNPAVVDYACDDAAVCLAIHETIYPEVKDDPIYALEMQVKGPTIDMQDRGVSLDFDFLRLGDEHAKAMAATMAEEVKDLLADLIGESRENMAILAQKIDAETLAKYKEKGKPVPDMNLNSADQLRRVVFDTAGLSTRRKTASGAMSTDAVALNTLSKTVPAIDRLLTYRSVVKMSGSYYGKWNKDYQGHPTGRAHPSWRQTGVDSGRYAVSDPPVQQCPKDYEFVSRGFTFAGNFRNAIVPADGCYFLDYDYSQIELRVIAALAKEAALIKAFDNDEDPHQTTADLMGITRNQGKTMNFGLMYQMGVSALSDRLGISKAEGQSLYDIYFSTYSAIGDWVEEQKFLGESRRYVETWFGRRIPIWEFQRGENHADVKKGRAIWANGERLCVNAPVQGSAADYMKMAMVRAKQSLVDAGLYGKKVWMILNVHDELLFEVDNDLAPSEVISILRPAVEFPIEGWPKIKTDWETGKTWGQILEVKE